MHVIHINACMYTQCNLTPNSVFLFSMTVCQNVLSANQPPELTSIHLIR